MKNTIRDMIVVAVMTAISFIVFTQFDFLEKIVQLSSEYEDYEIDEFVSASIVFSVCMVVYSIRRLRESFQLNKLLIEKNNELQKVLDEKKVLEGILPICSYCKKIRDTNGSWKQLESYIDSHSEAQFSHGICPECREIPKQQLMEMLKNKSH